MTQEQLVYYAKKLQEEWSLEQLIEKVFLNNNELGSPTTKPGADDLQKPAERGWVFRGQCPHCGKNSFQLSEARCMLRNELSIPNGFWAEPPAGGQDK